MLTFRHECLCLSLFYGHKSLLQLYHFYPIFMVQFNQLTFMGLILELFFSQQHFNISLLLDSQPTEQCAYVFKDLYSKFVCVLATKNVNFIGNFPKRCENTQSDGVD